MKDAVSGAQQPSVLSGGLPAAGASAVPKPKFDAVADVPQPGKRTHNADVRILLMVTAMGAIAGALVGIGLLPLLGPAAIVVGALMGAAMMLAHRTLK